MAALARQRPRMTAYNSYADLASSGVIATDRAQINNSFAAAISHHYSDDGTAPPSTWPGMLWHDAQANLLKQRNEADDAWLVVGTTVTGADGAPHYGALACYIAKAAESSDNIDFTVQVTDVQGDASADSVKGRRVLHVWIGTSDFGAPAGTQTVSATTGTVLEERQTDQELIVLTDADGTAVIRVNVSGAGTRYLMARVGDSEVLSLDGTWAA